MIRLFVPDNLRAGGAVALPAAQSHYLRDVMRGRVGDELLLFNGRDGEWRAAITATDRRGARVAPLERTRPQAEPPELELVVSPVKRGRLETIVEKATELGVGRIRLAITRFTQAGGTNVARLGAIAIEAAEQTGRLDVPQIEPPAKLDFILGAWQPGRGLIFCDESGEAAPILEALLPSWEKVDRVSGPEEGPRRRSGRDAKNQPAGAVRPPIRPGSARPPSPTRGEGALSAGVSILIGPEGGFSADERRMLRALPFVVPVSLGPRVLRADTAAIAALSLWQAAKGDWRP